MSASGLLFALLLPALASAAPRPSGLIIVDFDDLRADRAAKMPSLSVFASSAVVFEEAVTQAPWTLPATMSLFTSVYPHRHGIVNRFDSSAGERKEESRLAPRFTTLAEALRRAGFATAGFTGDAGVDAAYGFSRGFDVYGASVPFGGFELTMPQALDWLGRRPEGKRFFLFVHGYNLHGQHALPAGFAPETEEEFLALRRRRIEGESLPSDEASRAKWAGLYDARAAQADALFASFWRSARKLPGVEAAVVIVLADHGEELLEHGGLDHGMTLYDEVLRVPLIVRAPGRPPRRVRGQARLIDVLPTALELLGVDDAQARKQMQGASLVPRLSGGGQAPDSLAETDFLYRAAKRGLRTAAGLKFILDLETLNREVYDVRADSAEAVNLAGRDAQRDAALEAELRRLLDLPETAR